VRLQGEIVGFVVAQEAKAERQAAVGLYPVNKEGRPKISMKLQKDCGFQCSNQVSMPMQRFEATAIIRK